MPIPPRKKPTVRQMLMPKIPADMTETRRQGQGIGDIQAIGQMARTVIPEVLRNAPGTSVPMAGYDALQAGRKGDMTGAALAALGAVPFAGAMRYADEAQLPMREILDAADAAWRSYLRRNIPDVVYHGSPNRKLKSIDPNAAQEVHNTSWFSDNPDVAEQYVYPREYGQIVNTKKPGVVYPARLNVNNPYIVDLADRKRGALYAPGDAKTMQRLIAEAQAANRDALIVKNVDDTVDSSNIPGTSFAIWDALKAQLLPRKK